MLPKFRSLAAHARRGAPMLVLAAAAAVLAGCSGKKDAQPALLAVVGGQEIRADYYEDRLKNLEENELPKGPDASPLDMAQTEGKQAFLTTLINKAVMEAKAGQLGYAVDPRILEARKSLLAYQAGLAMYADAVGDPANELSNEEVDALYAMLGSQRRVSYLLCNFGDQAEAARAAAVAGADWDDLVKRYHVGEIPANGKMQMIIPFGRFDPDFEHAIFSTPVGEVGPATSTDFGWWVFRVESEKTIEKPSKENALAQILDLTRNRKIIKLRNAFEAEIHARFKLKVEDEGLLKTWQGLPPGEVIIDPATDKPVPQEQLAPLDVAPADLDLPLYSYEIDGQLKAFTVGDYKIKYDRMNTFQRPKREQLLGGLRLHIVNELDRALMDAEARARGYYEKPEVANLVNDKVNEMIVTAMYGDLVVIDEVVTPEQLASYWDAHHADFDVPEQRVGYLVIAADEAKAGEARAMAEAGAEWKDIVARFDTDEANKANGGRIEATSRHRGPVREAMFSLAVGELGQPFALGDGRYGIMRLESVTPAEPTTMEAAAAVIGQKIKAQRKEDLFNSLLAKWSAEVGVERHDENLSAVKSWKELTHVEAPGPAVPRN